MKRILAILIVGSTPWLLPPSPAHAHHSFAMFDNTKKVTITGTVMGFEWANPHAWLYVMGSADNGPLQKWSLEGTSPAMLSRKGWTKTDLKPGDKVVVVINPVRDGTLGGALNYVTLADGRVLGSYGAPPEPAQGAK